MTSELDRLRDADPVEPHVLGDFCGEDALLARILAEPRTHREQPRGRRSAVAVRTRLVVGTALACALLAAMTLGQSDPRAGGAVTEVIARAAGLERAYAAVLPRDGVIHEVVTSTWTVDGKPRGGERYEGWYRPSTGEALRRTGGDEGSTLAVVRADGVALVDGPDQRRFAGQKGLVPLAPGTDADAFAARNRRDFTAAFRASYEANELVDRGVGTFDGLPARRFEVLPRALDGIDGLSWYADPTTGKPLGSVERIGGQRNTRRLELWERVAPSAQALRQLTGNAATQG